MLVRALLGHFIRTRIVHRAFRVGLADRVRRAGPLQRQRLAGPARRPRARAAARAELGALGRAAGRDRAPPRG